MDTFVVTSKNRATSSLLKKLLKEMKGIERVTTLSKNEKEDIALMNAINKGQTNKIGSGKSWAMSKMGF